MKLLILFFAFSLFSLEPSVEQILNTILQKKEAIVQKEGEEGLFFLTFWNFDNTILDGDSTEGSKDIYGRVIFKGLAQVVIESGLSKKYSSFSDYLAVYEAMEKENAPKAYAYAAQILAGAKENDVRNLATAYFAKTLKPHLFAPSLELIQKLKEEGIEVIIITASPRLYVQGAAPLLGLSFNEVYGMETKVQKGIVTDQMVLPLTTGKGKIEKIEEIVRQKGAGKTFVLAGVGNHNSNDMPFLEWIAGQEGELAVIDYHVPQIDQPNFSLLPLESKQ